MGACKRGAVVLIKMGAYIHGVLIFYGCLLFRFYSRFCASRKRETGEVAGVTFQMTAHGGCCSWL